MRGVKPFPHDYWTQTIHPIQGELGEFWKSIMLIKNSFIKNLNI